MGQKWHTTNYIAEVCVSETGIFRGVTATSPSITWWLLFPKWDRCSEVGHSPNVISSFAVILSSLSYWKGAQSYKKLPEAVVPNVGHGPKMGQNGFDRACVSVVNLFLLCFIADSYEAGRGRTGMEVLACFRPCFLCVIEASKCRISALKS